MTGAMTRPASAAASRSPAASGDNAARAFDVESIRADFPVLAERVYDRPLVYLDNAASAQKPRAVMEAMDEAYGRYYSNVHRGVHRLSQVATDHFEAAREKVARFINAPRADDIVFTRGATESINLVAASYGRLAFKAGDEVVITALEHHSNIVPWQLLRDQLGIAIKVAPIQPDGSVRAEDVTALIGPRTKLVAVAHVSNALGSVLPVKEIIAAAHSRDVPVLLDGCQAVPHQRVDVQALDVDFYAFSAHKLYGPTGIGVLYGRESLMKAMPPYQGGGEMIASVSFEKTTFKAPPHRFEAGTPAIVEAIGMGAAVDYLSALDAEAVAAHEHDLLTYATEKLSGVEGLEIVGRAESKAAIISFVMKQAHPHDIGTIVDRAGVAIRAGHHCAQPLMDSLDLPATVRASFGLYNTRAEVDTLHEALVAVSEIFG